MNVKFHRHNLGNYELSAVGSVFKSDFLTTGENVKVFEREFAMLTKMKHCVGLSSCTAALHLGLEYVRYIMGNNKFVVATTPLTYVATVLPVIATGRRLLFIDVEENTGLLSTNELLKVADDVDLVIPIHLYGQVCDMVQIGAIAEHFDFLIMEDSAHVIHGMGHGNYPGYEFNSIGAAYSFYATKAITCGEGGAFCTNNLMVTDFIRKMAQHGINKTAYERYNGIDSWDLEYIGWKYNMSDIQASILLAQLKRELDFWDRRKLNEFAYRNSLDDIVDFPEISDSHAHDYLMTTMWVDPGKRDKIMEELRKLGIGISMHYKPLHLIRKIAVYKDLINRTLAFPNAELIGSRTISLPNYPLLTKKEIEYVIDSVRKVVRSV